MNYLKKININLLLALIIPLLIWGPFFPDLIVSLSSTFFLFYVYKNKAFNYFTQTPLIIFFAFCIYCIFVSIFVAPNILMSFESSLFYFRIGVFSCLIWYLIEQDKKILNYFYYAIVICFLVLIIDGYIQFFTNTNSVDRVSSFFGDELIMGSYLSRLFPLLVALFIAKEKKKLETYFMFLFFILVSGLIFISGERASFAFLTLSTLFVLLLTKNFLKFRLCFIFGSVILILMLSLTNQITKNRMFVEPFETSGLLQKNEDKKYFFTANHDSLIRTSFNMFKDKPLIGHGPKMFRVICKDEKYATGITPCMTHVHNFYVQLLAETGIIGFSFLFSVFAYVMYCVYRQFKSMVLRQKKYLSDYQVCLLASILITAWPITTNGNFFNNWLMIVYSLPVGFYLHSLYGKNKEEINNN